ncbi:MAG TPA: tetratricopeptide repeat protein, partial [Candidatus Binatia bacterium]|nr:tetratricopeptide repeat protein [Candidatus Binatia bacterium]
MDLGIAYLTGAGVKHSDEEAVRWFREADAGGLADAMGILGSVYLIGQGVTVDYGLALKYNEKAAHHGSAIGQCNLGKIHELGRGQAGPQRGAGVVSAGGQT